jgi:enediyne biosynthesis protein E4
MRFTTLVLPTTFFLLGGCWSAQKPAEPTAAPKQSPAAIGPLLSEATPASLQGYRWEVGGKRPLNILQTIGNGAGFVDVDGDGNLDLILVGTKTALFGGDGKGGFTDITRASGIEKLVGRTLSGVAVGDIDNDGDPDLYLYGWRTGILLENRKGAFLEKSGAVLQEPWVTSGALADVNRDGFLDLYVGSYVVFGTEVQPQLCPGGKLAGETACGPRFYQPLPGKLLQGSAEGRFTPWTGTGIETTHGKALGAAFAAPDGDGAIHLALANDEMPGDLLRFSGSKAENIGESSGTAFDAEGGLHGGMGIDWGDIDNDGKLDLFVATYQREAKCLYLNQGGGIYAEISSGAGLFDTRPFVAFGGKLADFDNDGRLDLLIANGHVQSNAEKVDATTQYRQPTQLFLQTTNKRFENASQRLSKDAQRPLVGRGLAVGDYDNDGKVDALVVDSEGTPLLLHNEAPSAGWIGFSLSQPGTHPGGRDAYTATITVTVGGKKLVRHCHTDGSYLSASDPRVHFGLGSAQKPEQIEVLWPDGTREALAPLDGGRYWTLTRGQKPR